MSFDGGKTWSFIYKLNNTNNVSFDFQISKVKQDSNNLDYPYYFRYNIKSLEVFNTIKNKPLSLFIGNETETISF